jgi:multidrug resistance efflux pump
MRDLATQLPVRSSELTIHPLGGGRYVVKDPRTGEYFQLGAEEHFLLSQLDGEKDAASVREAFADLFGQSLTDEDLQEFIDSAREQGLLHSAETVAGSSRVSTPSPRSRQSLLSWRKNFFDPDRLFSWLEPKIRFFWTPAFLIFSALLILVAALLLWANRGALAASLTNALHWESIFWAWLVVGAVTLLHESAHGLTCKHFGGEVHEIGFLLMFFMPCFYCNVSDAWLFPEKSKRLWVTVAGGYFELFLWALAVIVWELTVPDSFANYASFIVLSACGVQSLFNFFPLLKLDGYYLLSDATEIPNLRQRAMERWQTHLKRWLWGAPSVTPEPKGRFLTLFGALSWCFSLVFLVALFSGMAQWMSETIGLAGISLLVAIGTVSTFGMLKGVFAGEFGQMIYKRRLRTLAWIMVLVCIPLLLCLWEIEDKAGGEFQFRSTVRAELRAPASAFLRDVYIADGQHVSPGSPVLILEIPDLESRLTQKRAELAESESQLRILEAGTRPEEISAQRQRIASARRWRDVVKSDLEKSRDALKLQLSGLDQQIARAQAELAAAESRFWRIQQLYEKKVATDEQLTEVESDYSSAKSRLAQVRAEQNSLEARGVLLVEAQLAEREKEVSDHEATLALMQAGSRPDEIAAQRARVARLQEEERYLHELQTKLVVYSPVSGVVTTPRLREKIGQHFPEGELIGLVEDPGSLEAEIRLDERSVRRVGEFQLVALKARGFPLESIPAHIRRLAPAATTPEANTAMTSHVTVFCDLDHPDPRLAPGMGGYARIYTGRRPVGSILLDRLLRHLRTEYWWYPEDFPVEQSGRRANANRMRLSLSNSSIPLERRLMTVSPRQQA